MKEKLDRRKTYGVHVANAEETCRMYALLEITVPPGSGPPPHTHLKEDEGFYVLEGSFRVGGDGSEPVDLGAGEHAFGPRKVGHYFRNIGDTPGRLLLMFTPGGCERYFADLAAARANPGDDLLEREEAIDRKYCIYINRRV